MLVNTIDHIQKHFPTVVGMDDFELFRTYMEDAERWLKREILGTTLYNLIDSGQEDYDNIELVDFCRKIISLKGGYVAIPFLDLIMTNNGFAVKNNQNMAPASKDRVNSLIASILTRYYDELEELFIFLEENTQFHEAWKDSQAYTSTFDHILISAEEFNEYVYIDSSRLIFAKLLPSLTNVEKLEISKHISREFLNELIEQQKTNTLTNYNLLIIDNLRAAAANYAMSRGIEPLSVIIDEKGISRSYAIGSKAVADENRMLILKKHFEETASKYMGEVVAELDANTDNYPTYRDSDIYKTKGSFQGYQNDQSSIFVSA